MQSKNGTGRKRKIIMKCKLCKKNFKIRYQNGLRVSTMCDLCLRKKEREKKRRQKEREKMKKRKKREKKQNSFIYLRNKYDKIWSLKIKEKAQFKCELCGIKDVLNSHHYIGRRNMNTRWYIPNGICLCSGHHVFFTQSAHENPEWFRKQILELRGEYWLDDLVRKNSTIWDKDFDKIKEYLENYDKI